MNPQYDHVGLAVLPPLRMHQRRPDAASVPLRIPSQYNYDNRNADYTIVGLSSDYASPAGTLNAGSNLVRRHQLPAVGGTHGLRRCNRVQRRTSSQPRVVPGVQKVIIFLSDGAANYGGTWHPAGSPYRTTACRQGVTSSNIAKTAWHDRIHHRV